MKTITKAIVTAGTLVSALAGCAHQASTPSPAQLASAYGAVSTGAEPVSNAGRYRFCGTPDAIKGLRTNAETTDDWLDRARSNFVNSAVKDVLRHDHALAEQPIDVMTIKGEVWLTGQVASDALAARAVADVLEVEGVVDVKSRLVTPESPRPRYLTAAATSFYCF